ncbi:MAG: hypothetical protein M0C28_38975 [Candidatus Moduliflexus flocculans]|nr:hypothetical protein [Candidatus Moduliflexus flocculans]
MMTWPLEVRRPDWPPRARRPLPPVEGARALARPGPATAWIRSGVARMVRMERGDEGLEDVPRQEARWPGRRRPGRTRIRRSGPGPGRSGRRSGEP